MSLYLGAVHFDGDPDALVPAYRRLLERFPVDSLDAHISIRHATGLTVFDACPSQEIYEAFTTGGQFLDAVDAAGLPRPRVEGLGQVEVAHVRQRVGT